MWSFCKIKFTSKFVAIVGGWFPLFLHALFRLFRMKLDASTSVSPLTPPKEKNMGQPKIESLEDDVQKGPTPQLLKSLEAPKGRFWQGSKNIWVNANFLRCCAMF